MIHVLGPHDKSKMNRLGLAGVPVISTVSRSDTWSKGLSPFYLGPCALYGGRTARNVENGWQFSKVYKEHVGEDGNPSLRYFEWAESGWSDSRAHRYPMGKGAKPEYSWWDGEKLGYVQARKRIYAPLYIKAVARDPAWKKLKEECGRHDEVILWDFDGYDHRALDMSYEDVLNCADRTMGHAFILAMLLECRDEVMAMLER